MTGVMLVRPVSAVVWELRAAWATGRRVALSLSSRCVVRRVEGWVQSVAATGAVVWIAGWHVPVDAILAVHHPSRLGDSSARAGEWAGAPRRVVPQREELW
jgi:hypothetical protein